MKNVGRYIAIVTIGAAGSAWAAAPTCAPPSPALNPEFAVPAQGLAFPSFCSIPPAPKHVRSAQAFRSAVVTTRLAGAAVVNQSAPDTFSLGDTTGFVGDARREALPPAPMTSPSEGDTEAFVAKSKARATPPARPRHRH
ncbi:MAG TPA: hypothetical protein VIJ59_06825 [Caulobacteraceae bacterium]